MRTGIIIVPPAFFIMMKLCELKRGEGALVLSVNGDPALSERLRILGIHAGARVKVLRTSLFRKTFLVSTGTGKAALGRSVAAGVNVCPIR